MKKNLLFILAFISITSQAQDFWTQVSTEQPATSTGVRSISIVNPSVTWLNMSCGTAGCTPIRRYARTINGGNSWDTGEINLGPTTANLLVNNIHGISATTAYASVYPKNNSAIGQGGVYKTTDSGATWNRLDGATYAEPSSFPSAVYFWNANEGIVVGDAADGYFEIYRTTDAGLTWTRIPSSSAITPIDPDEYIWNDAQFATAGNSIWIYTTFGRMLRSADKGLTWTMVFSPIVDFCRCITASPPPNFAFTDENNGLISDDGYMLYSTSDAGATWQNVEWTGQLRSFGIAAVPGMTGAYISLGEEFQSATRGSSYSINGGQHWIDINDNPDTDYVQGGVIAMLNEDYGFASGFTTSPTEGGIYRWGGGNMLRQAHLSASAFGKDKSVSVAPNPTTGVLNINGKAISRVIVYDVLGKEVVSENYNLSSRINFDISALNAGLYLVKVFSTEGSSAIKIVKQ